MPFYYPEMGGVESVARCLSEELSRRGHEVTVYTYNVSKGGRRGIYEHAEVVNGVKVKRFVPVLQIHYGSVAPQLPFVLSKEKVDVLHVHCYRHPHTEQSWIAAARNNAKTILHSHSPFYPRGVTPFTAWIWYKMYDRLARYTVFKRYERVIALTPDDKNELVVRGCQPEKISVIPNPLPKGEEIEETLSKITNEEIEEYKDGHGLTGEPIILFLGRMTQSKRIHLLVAAITEVLKERKEAQLVLAGPDENTVDGLTTLSKRLAIGDRVKYLGTLTEPEKTLLYLSSNVYVLPSLYDGYGLTLLEAQAHGLPVVAFNRGGQRHAVLNGVLVDREEDLAKGILEASDLPRKLHLDKHSAGRYTSKIEAIYKK